MRVHLEEFICARRQWFIYDHPRHTHTSIGIWEMKSWIALVHLMLWGTCALLCSTVFFVACHRWINHMSDKASKGQALFTIVLKYAQICLKRRKNATSRAGTKLPTDFLECIFAIEHLKSNNLGHMMMYPPINSLLSQYYFTEYESLMSETSKFLHKLCSFNFHMDMWCIFRLRAFTALPIFVHFSPGNWVKRIFDTRC